jgi:myosin-15
MEGSRPFVDPYGRAKTVRIGKWRWPPAGEDNFTEFKLRQESKNNIEKPEPPPVPVVKVARPFGDAVGKLKISNEMRMKLEQVHSVRGPSPNKMNGRDARDGRDEIVPKKIGEDRKMLLAEKLGGMAPPPPPPPPIISPPSFMPQCKYLELAIREFDPLLSFSQHVF